jgi:DNA primase
MLADRAGIVLTPADHSGPPPPAGSPDDKQTLYRAMAWAADRYHDYLLNSVEAASARDYLASRSVDASSIARFQLGFAPEGWQWLLDQAARAAFSPEVLTAVGLALRSERTGKWLDRFRGRVIFPICDTQRRTIALGGRILPQLADDQSAKYINSPETRLFSKSEQHYGLHLAREASGRDRTVLVMEGYTDVVIAHQLGVDQAVAVLGTALGPRHIPVLRRFADRITLILDGDEAGQRRANEILELFIAQQLDLRIVTLPDRLDPCDFLLQRGRQALEQLVQEAPDALEHKLQMATRGLDPLRQTHQANQALEELLALLAAAPRAAQSATSQHRLREQQILNRLARVFRVDEQELRARLKERRRPSIPRGIASSASTRPTTTTTTTPATPTPTAKFSLETVERELFELLLQRPEAVRAVLDQVHVTQLRSMAARELYRHWAQLVAEGGSPGFDQLLVAIDDPAMKSLLVDMDEAGRQKSGVDHELLLRDLLTALAKRTAEEQLRSQQAALESDDLDDKQQLDLLLNILRTKNEITSG